jgi:hypothetical protein
MELIEMIINFNIFLEQSIFFRGGRFIVGIVVVVLSLDVMLLLYVLLLKDKYYRAFSLGHGVPDVVNTMKRRWARVVKLIGVDDSRRRKDAIIEAGNMVYELLQSIGHEGASLDEMLDSMVGPQLANIEDLKNASKIKNVVINDEDYQLSNEVALTTVRSFGEALIEHKAIDDIGI